MKMAALSKRRRESIFEDQHCFKLVDESKVWGAEAHLRALEPVIEQIRDVHSVGLGAIDGGIVFYGPKGSGKTYLARYVATKSEARFINIRRFPRHISDGREDDLCPEDIRELCKLAREYVEKKKRPIILFCDEVEELHDDIFEELRMEIDGLQGRSVGIFFLVTAAVDDPLEIDEGLFRPGRINIHIPLWFSNTQARESLLRGYLSSYKCKGKIDIESIAHMLSDSVTPAAIAQFVKDAHRNACFDAKNKKAPITEHYLLSRVLQELTGFVVCEFLSFECQRRVAYHEAGHAAVARFLNLPVPAVTILPTIDGSTFIKGQTICNFPEDEIQTVEMAENMIAMALGGIAAERLFGIPPSIATQNDLGSATEQAIQLVDCCAHGKELFEEFGYTVFLEPKNQNSEILRQKHERDIARIIAVANDRAKRCLQKIGKTKIKKIAKALLKKNPSPERSG